MFEEIDPLSSSLTPLKRLPRSSMIAEGSLSGRAIGCLWCPTLVDKNCLRYIGTTLSVIAIWSVAALTWLRYGSQEENSVGYAVVGALCIGTILLSMVAIVRLKWLFCCTLEDSSSRPLEETASTQELLPLSDPCLLSSTEDWNDKPGDP